MALHGDISINGRELWTWEARRVTGTTLGRNLYRVSLYEHAPNLAFQAPAGGRPVELASTDLYHVYEDGGIVLAAKVLEWAASVAGGSTVDG